MVKRTSRLFAVTIVCIFQAVGCSDPAEELCDQPEGGGTGEVGDDGPGISLEHTDPLQRAGPEFTSSNPQGRAPLAHETRTMTLDVDAPSRTLRNWAEDPRVPVTEEDELQSYPLRTVVSISLSYEVPDGIRTDSGTGFLAGPRHVITNRHVVQVYGADINEWLEEPPVFFGFDVFPGRSNSANPRRCSSRSPTPDEVARASPAQGRQDDHGLP